ncbi:MAG TPA: hypothetical protein VHR66_11680 [Gemmataceae bacterium]|jgi:DNA repair exonuclease SbcCD ATPase subunit|nr:hypothetical protein [Gemmataceae bacterium]
MSEPNRRRRWYRLAAVLLVLLIGYGSYRAIRPDPNLKKVKQLRDEFATQSKDWTPEQRAEKGKEMRTAMEKLSPAQRDVLAAEGRKKFEEQLRQYAQMSPQQKIQYLDDQINRSEQMRQQFAQQNGGAPRPPGGGPGTFGGGPNGPGGGGKQMSQEEREKRRKERLDQTTPEFRALMDQYRKDMNARRQQRGLATRG